jgi:hypothetical protein
VTELTQLLRERGTAMQPARLALQRRLPCERDFAVRAAISEALQGIPAADAATAPQPQNRKPAPAPEQATAATPRDRAAQPAPDRRHDNAIRQTKTLRALWLAGGSGAILFVIGVFWASLRPLPTSMVSTHNPPTAPAPQLGSWSSTPVNPDPVPPSPAKALNPAYGGEQYPAAGCPWSRPCRKGEIIGSGPHPDTIAGTYYGTYSATQVAGQAHITAVFQQTGSDITTEYQTSTGITGSGKGKLLGNTATMRLENVSPACPGEFEGTYIFKGNKVTFTATGSDCAGNELIDGEAAKVD